MEADIPIMCHPETTVKANMRLVSLITVNWVGGAYISFLAVLRAPEEYRDSERGRERCREAEKNIAVVPIAESQAVHKMHCDARMEPMGLC